MRIIARLNLGGPNFNQNHQGGKFAMLLFNQNEHVPFFGLVLFNQNVLALFRAGSFFIQK